MGNANLFSPLNQGSSSAPKVPGLPGLKTVAQTGIQMPLAVALPDKYELGIGGIPKRAKITTALPTTLAEITAGDPQLQKKATRQKAIVAVKALADKFAAKDANRLFYDILIAADDPYLILDAFQFEKQSKHEDLINTLITRLRGDNISPRTIKLVAAAAEYMGTEVPNAKGKQRKNIKELIDRLLDKVNSSVDSQPDYPYVIGARHIQEYTEDPSNAAYHLERVNKALLRHPRYPKLLATKAQILFGEGRAVEACRTAAQLLQQRPEHDLAHRIIKADIDDVYDDAHCENDIFNLQHDLHQSTVDLDSFHKTALVDSYAARLTHEPKNAVIRATRAILLDDIGRYKESQQEARLAYDASKDHSSDDDIASNPYVIYAFAHCLLRDRKYDEEVYAELEAASEKYPNSCLINYALAKCLWHMAEAKTGEERNYTGKNAICSLEPMVMALKGRDQITGLDRRMVEDLVCWTRIVARNELKQNCSTAIYNNERAAQYLRDFGHLVVASPVLNYQAVEQEMNAYRFYTGQKRKSDLDADAAPESETERQARNQVKKDTRHKDAYATMAPMITAELDANAEFGPMTRSRHIEFCKISQQVKGIDDPLRDRLMAAVPYRRILAKAIRISTETQEAPVAGLERMLGIAAPLIPAPKKRKRTSYVPENPA